MNQKSLVVLLVTCVSLSATTAFGRGGLTENQRSLAIGAGVAAPSFNVTGAAENPVGYAFNATAKVHGYVAIPDGASSLYDIGGKITFGRGYYGFSLNYRYDQVSSANADHQIGGAASFIVRGMKLGFGVSGYYRSSSGSGQPGADASLGILINPYGRLKVGVGAFNLNGGADTYGVGFAFALAKQLTFALDAGVGPSFDGLSFKPGIGYQFMNLQLSAGYGFAVSGDANTGIGDGLYAGIALWPSRFFMIQAYYQHDQKIFAGFSLRM